MEIWYAKDFYTPHHRLSFTYKTSHTFLAVEDGTVLAFATLNANHSVEIVGTRKDRRCQGVLSRIYKAGKATLGDINVSHTGHTSDNGLSVAEHYGVDVHANAKKEEHWDAEEADLRTEQLLGVYQKVFSEQRAVFALVELKG
ncbi:hypothetical protein [Rhodococcus pyridinivorans]|uniref:hypothetical protein n=1 Tax=Rhodococcus pyridinivorans TaxID=103816 RepID=UPI00207918C5|nr:hypothetical protein [Rhodococcus pyridinivorans]USI88757.1 hypothetical protein LLA01_14145 [Rhodococcus pyridinivorans]